MIQLQNISYPLSATQKSSAQASSDENLVIDSWSINQGEHWAIFSTDSRCSALLGQMLAQEILLTDEQMTGLPSKTAWVSLAKQQELLELELANEDTDFLDRIDYGTSVEQLVKEACQQASLEPNQQSEQLERLLNQLDLVSLRERGFRQLSTGQTRRVMLARALALSPQLLILDDPYSGLDVEHQQALSVLLSELAANMQIILMISRESDIPEVITHIAMFQPKTLPSGKINHKLGQGMSLAQWKAHPVLQQLNQLSNERSDEVLALLHQHKHQIKFADPLVELKNAKVEYTDGLIFDKVNWRIEHGQHWQIRGPNGCGKSTLLGLIIGDHPQCYSNDITIFGEPRGQGETIWQVKQNIGIVSSALHLQYRVNCSALEVLLSGFFDSIGLYQAPSKKQIELAHDWLAILHMSELKNTGFKQLDYGQQRLLLIGRALIKQPALLVLDEPYQGLDFINRKLVMKTLNMIAEENLSQLLYVSHHLEDVLPAIKNHVDFIESESSYVVKVSMN